MDIIRRSAPAIWLLVLVSSILMALTLPFGGDAKVYENTVKEVRSGISPYASGIARLQLRHARNEAGRTMNYIYPPMTLPLVRAIGDEPAWLRTSAFWSIYMVGIWLLLRTEEVFLNKNERKFFLALSPICVFFPGLLNDDFLLAGNIAPILYGLVCAAAIWDWKHNQWKWFYMAVLFAAIFKAPMLTLLAIPVFTSVGEWLKATVTGLTGCVLILFQGLIWPEALHTYIQMMNLEFAYNQEFGFGPAGMLGKILIDRGIPFLPGYCMMYLVSSIIIFLLLLSLSRHFKAGRLSTQDWMPVLLVGVILLSPRIKQYDAEAITLPMAVIAWRTVVERTRGKRQAVLLSIALFAVGNVFVAFANAYDFVETLLMVALFSHAAWNLHQKVAHALEETDAVAELLHA